MEFAISIPSSADSWKLVARAEALGFTSAWFMDTQLLNADVFVSMTAAAVNTSKIRLGTGVLVPANRLAPVAANALASLNKLAPGRIDFGIGSGFTARRSMGLRPIKIREMEEYIVVVQKLLRGETVEWDHEGAKRKIRFLNPETGMINIEDSIPTYVAAVGPRGRQVVANLGTRWFNSLVGPEPKGDDFSDMRRRWADAGRRADDLFAVAHVGGCVIREGESYDSPRVKAQAGPSAAMMFHNLVEAPSDDARVRSLPPPMRATLDGYRALYERYEPEDARYLSVHKGHLMFLRPEEEPIISGDLIRKLTFTGDAEHLRERIRGLRDAGYRQLSIRQVDETSLEDWARVIEGV